MRKVLLSVLLALACSHDEGRPVPTAPEPRRGGGSGLHAMSIGLPEIKPLCACPAGYTEYTGGDLPGSDNGRGCWKCYDNYNDPPQPSNSCGVAVGPPVIPCGGSLGGTGGEEGARGNEAVDAPTIPSFGFLVPPRGAPVSLTLRDSSNALRVTLEVGEWNTPPNWCMEIDDPRVIAAAGHFDNGDYDSCPTCETDYWTERHTLSGDPVHVHEADSLEWRNPYVFVGDGPYLAGVRRYWLPDQYTHAYRITSRKRIVILSGAQCEP